ncbi:ABC transporter permease/substrate-binding protein [Pontibacter silvestris]|uniref:ABC transporter permease/substrate-binding protein n=1 Tax=Pontibacter silvestris TaxID=2305183 RepID=A0ABW4WYU4_9BACT|nr:ABC transporter permease/substrate-binding protein [Pontibacter silvestris]MCC9138483.1 ABC transporter permease/substrate-binding protein [Pontibacter silvestris]
MDQQQNLWEFFLLQGDKILSQTVTHIGLTFASLLLAMLLGLPTGMLIAKRRRLSGPVLSTAGIFQTIPSIALLGFMIPLLGIGTLPAIVVLFLYALLPVVRNTYVGITGVDEGVKDAAKGMGMTERQILFKVELPLALPVIMAGIRTATVINVGVATLAAYIAGGGLGEFIFAGIALNNTNMILAGAIPASLLAVLFDYLLGKVQLLQPARIRKAALAFSVATVFISGAYLMPSTGNQLLAGFEPEFMGRTDGYLGLKSKYKLDIPTVVIGDALMYKALYENKLDVIGGYSTDGRLKAYDLKILKDDRTIFPPYYAAPVVRAEVLENYPELRNALGLLKGMIDDATMTDLNYRVDFLKQSPEKVAKDFLLSKQLWRVPQKGNGGVIRIGSKIFGEQYILAEIYSMLIRGHTNLEVETKTGLGGTKICFDALLHKQIDLYPEYTGTGLLVILQPDPRTVDSLIASREKVFQFVQEQFEKRYGLIWLDPIGFNNTYALMMRRRQAQALNLKTITDLKQYLEEND